MTQGYSSHLSFSTMPASPVRVRGYPLDDIIDDGINLDFQPLESLRDVARELHLKYARLFTPMQIENEPPAPMAVYSFCTRIAELLKLEDVESGLDFDIHDMSGLDDDEDEVSHGHKADDADGYTAYSDYSPSDHEFPDSLPELKDWRGGSVDSDA